MTKQQHIVRENLLLDAEYFLRRYRDDKVRYLYEAKKRLMELKKYGGAMTSIERCRIDEVIESTIGGVDHARG